jgi:hypothetical protein
MPYVVVPPTEIDPLYDSLLALTFSPLCVTAAFQEFEIVSLVSANSKPVVHSVSGTVPVSVTVSWSWYPPSHESVTEEVSEQAPPPEVEVGEGDGDGDVVVGEGDGDGEVVVGEGDGDGDVTGAVEVVYVIGV